MKLFDQNMYYELHFLILGLFEYHNMQEFIWRFQFNNKMWCHPYVIQFKYNKDRHLPWLAYRVVSHQQECFHLFIYKLLGTCLLQLKLSILIVHEKSQKCFNMTADKAEDGINLLSWLWRTQPKRPPWDPPWSLNRNDTETYLSIPLFILYLIFMFNLIEGGWEREVFGLY